MIFCAHILPFITTLTSNIIPVCVFTMCDLSQGLLLFPAPISVLDANYKQSIQQ